MRSVAVALLCATTPAIAGEPNWIASASGGSISRQGDATRAYGSASLTRRFGRAYVRASVTRFEASIQQGPSRSVSTYTLGFVSAGATFGRWFVDGYGAAGRQHRPADRSSGAPPGFASAYDGGVIGAGGDVGRVLWLGARWSLTPSASVQYFRLRIEDPTAGPPAADGSSASRRQTGTTLGATLRVDHFIGADRSSSVGIRATRFHATNALAALASGTIGGGVADFGAGSSSDDWTDVGGSAAIRLRRYLYGDVSVSRTFGVRLGEITTTALGVRYLF